MGLRKLWELAVEGAVADGSRSRRLLERYGIVVRLEEVQVIDPTDFDADFLVVALGAEARPDLVPRLEEHGHDVWRKEGLPALSKALREFEGGSLVVAITGGPYPCPPAPFECVMLLEEWLRERGLRGATELAVITFQPILLPDAWSAGLRVAGRSAGRRRHPPRDRTQGRAHRGRACCARRCRDAV